MEMDDKPRNSGRRERDQWRVSREIPITMIVTLVLQAIGVAGAIVWSMAIQSTKFAGLENRMDGFEKKLDNITVSVSAEAVPNARLGMRVDYLEARLNELRVLANDNGRRITALEARVQR